MIRNEPPKHNATVIGGYKPYAQCGCGWVGPSRGEYPWAKTDADQHNLNATTGPFRPTFQKNGFLG